MAELDIRLDVDFPDHPKTKRLIRRLGPEAVICLLRLWGFTAQHHPDGILTGMDEEAITDAAGWMGEVSGFVDALMRGLRANDPSSRGYLEQDEMGNYRCHDWANHQPYIADYKARSERGRNAARARWRKVLGCESDAGRMPDACRSDAPSLHPSVHPSKDQDHRSPAAPALPVDNVDKPIKTKPKKKKAAIQYSAEFERVYAPYPYKAGKFEAFKAYQNIADPRPSDDELIAAIGRYEKTIEGKKKRGEFAPEYCLPATWFNQRRWEDEPDAGAPPPPLIKVIEGERCNCQAAVRFVINAKGQRIALECSKCGVAHERYE